MIGWLMSNELERMRVRAAMRQLSIPPGICLGELSKTIEMWVRMSGNPTEIRIENSKTQSEALLLLEKQCTHWALLLYLISISSYTHCNLNWLNHRVVGEGTVPLTSYCKFINASYFVWIKHLNVLVHSLGHAELMNKISVSQIRLPEQHGVDRKTILNL